MLAQTKNHQTVATVTCQTQDFIVGSHHRVAAKKVSKVKRGRPATSVHGFVLVLMM
jgi:hypothetical protein